MQKVVLFLFITFQVTIVTTQTAGKGEIASSNDIPQPRFQNELNKMPDISMPPALLPEAFRRKMSPVLRNNQRLRTSSKTSKRRNKQNRHVAIKSKSNVKRSQSKNNNVRDSDGPFPILRSGNILNERKTMPLTFGALGILPTDLNVKNSGRRIRQDRTLDEFNQNQPQLQTSGFPQRPSEINSVQSRGFLDTTPLAAIPENVDFSTQNRPFQDVATQPQWPTDPHFGPVQQINDFTGNPVSFPSSFQTQQWDQIEPSVLRSSTLNARPLMFPFRTVRWSPFVSTIPIPINYLPFYSLSDNFDIDDYYHYANSFLPRIRRFTQLSQVVNQPTLFSSSPVIGLRRRVLRMPVQRRPVLRPVSSSIPFTTFQTTSPLPRMAQVISTPPSVQRNSVLPPPSAFIAPVYRDDDFAQLIQTPFYNPYMYDTFLSDFSGNPGNVSRSDSTGSDVTGVEHQQTELVQPFTKDIAHRIKISRKLGLHDLSDQRFADSNRLEERNGAAKRFRLKRLWYKDAKAF